MPALPTRHLSSYIDFKNAFGYVQPCKTISHNGGPRPTRHHRTHWQHLHKLHHFIPWGPLQFVNIWEFTSFNQRVDIHNAHLRPSNVYNNVGLVLSLFDTIRLSIMRISHLLILPQLYSQFGSNLCSVNSSL